MGTISWNGIQSDSIDPKSKQLNCPISPLIGVGDSLVKQAMRSTWSSPCLITNMSLYVPCSVFKLSKLRAALHELWRVCQETGLWCIMYFEMVVEDERDSACVMGDETQRVYEVLVG